MKSGAKTELARHRLQWNGDVYRGELGQRFKVAFFAPGVVGIDFINTNGQNSSFRWIETSLLARVVTGLTLQGAASATTAGRRIRHLNSTTILARPRNVRAAGHGRPAAAFGWQLRHRTNPFGPVGSPRANEPPVQSACAPRKMGHRRILA